MIVQNTFDEEIQIVEEVVPLQKEPKVKVRSTPTRVSSRNKASKDAKELSDAKECKDDTKQENTSAKGRTTIVKCEQTKFATPTTSSVPLKNKPSTVKEESFFDKLLPSKLCKISNPFFGQKSAQATNNSTSKAQDEDKVLPDNKEDQVNHLPLKPVDIPFLDSTIPSIDMSEPNCQTSFTSDGVTSANEIADDSGSNGMKSVSRKISSEQTPEIPGLNSVTGKQPLGTLSDCQSSTQRSNTDCDGSKILDDHSKEASSTVKPTSADENSDKDVKPHIASLKKSLEAASWSREGEENLPSTSEGKLNISATKVNGASEVIQLNPDRCINIGCANRPISDPEWDNEFCSAKCAVENSKMQFRNWIGMQS